MDYHKIIHCKKSVCTRSFSSPYFPAFGHLFCCNMLTSTSSESCANCDKICLNYLRKKHGMLNDGSARNTVQKSFLQILSHLLEKSLIENFIFLCSEKTFSWLELEITWIRWGLCSVQNYVWIYQSTKNGIFC